MKALKQLEVPEKRAGFSGTSFCLSYVSHDAWIIDSGASDHIICDENLFSHTHADIFLVTVKLPNENIINVTKIGTIHLSSSITL